MRDLAILLSPGRDAGLSPQDKDRADSQAPWAAVWGDQALWLSSVVETWVSQASWPPRASEQSLSSWGRCCDGMEV